MSIFRTPDEVTDYAPASYAPATKEAHRRLALIVLEREQLRADWRNGQLKYQVEALAFRREVPVERRPVLAWTSEAR